MLQEISSGRRKKIVKNKGAKAGDVWNVYCRLWPEKRIARVNASPASPSAAGELQLELAL